MKIRMRLFAGMLFILGAVATLVVSPSAGAAVGPTATVTMVARFHCTPTGFAMLAPPPADQDITVTLSAPTEVTVGQTFQLSSQVSPFVLPDAGFSLSTSAVHYLGIVGGTIPGALISAAFNYAGGTTTIPTMAGTVTPTAAAGGSVVMTTTQVHVKVGSTGYECAPVTAPGQPAQTIITKVVSSLTPTSSTTSTSSTTTTSTTSTTSTTTSSTSTSTSTTTSTTTPTDNQATVLTVEKTAAYTCNIFDAQGVKFNVNPLPPANITLILTYPNKVSVGGTVTGTMKMKPGPANGPVKLAAGTARFAAALELTSATPSSLAVLSGTNAVAIEANASTESPEMPFTVTAAGAAGDQIAITATNAEVRVTTPLALTTRCVPNAALGSIGLVSIVAEQIIQPTTTSTTSTTVKDGFANCSEAKAAGRGTILKSDPAYRSWLDADNDGLACEADQTSVAGKVLAKTGEFFFSKFMLALSLALIGTTLLVGARRKFTES